MLNLPKKIKKNYEFNAIQLIQTAVLNGKKKKFS